MEYSFIQFSDVLEANSCVALPIVQPSDLAFFLEEGTTFDGISAIDIDGNVLQEVVEFDIVDNWVKLKGEFTFEVDKCFALKIYTNTLIENQQGFSLSYNTSTTITNLYGLKKQGYGIRVIKDISEEGAICTDIDGNTYNTVTINGKTWTANNLYVTKYRDGSTIPWVASGALWDTTNHARGVYNDLDSNKTLYGYHYNGYAAFNAKNIAPVGWHIATKQEYESLISYLSVNYGTSLNAAKALASSTLWNTSAVVGSVGLNQEINNFSGLNFTPNGQINNNGSNNLGDNCEIWMAQYESQSGEYSNILRLTTTEENTVLRYSCNEPQYGFAYDVTGSYNQVRLPIRIYAPQPLQEKTVYKGADGVVHVLSATMKKEYLLETEYIPEQWHDNLVIALNHDTVTLDTVSLSNEEYDYSINWDEYTDTECGERLTKGSTKMQQNKINRNTNCE